MTGKLDAGATALVFDMMTTDVTEHWIYGNMEELWRPQSLSDLCLVVLLSVLSERIQNYIQKE